MADDGVLSGGASFSSGKEGAAGGDGAGLFGPAPEHTASLTPHDGKIAPPDFGFLPDGLQGLSEGYGDAAAFWADVSRLKGMDAELAAVRGVRPETLATDEDFDRAFKALGRPDDKSGYALPEVWEGETWSAEGPSGRKASPEVTAKVNEWMKNDGDQFADLARRCNLTQKQAAALHEYYGGVLARSVERRNAAYAPERVLPELWGERAEQELQTARRGARIAGLAEALDAEGISAHPLVLRLCHALGDRLAEDSPAGLSSSGGATLPRGEEARAELRKVVSSRAYQEQDPASMRLAVELAGRVQG